MTAVDKHYQDFVFPHVINHGQPNINISIDYDNLGGDTTKAMKELRFLTLPKYGGAAPEVHGSKSGEFNIKLTVGKRALQLLLRRPRSALGPLFKAEIERGRQELKKTQQFMDECRERQIDPDKAFLNVVYAKINLYLKTQNTAASSAAASSPVESGTALHRDKVPFFARLLASLITDGTPGGPVAPLFFALLGYDGVSRLFGRRSLPRKDLDVLILLSGCQRYGEACAKHGVQHDKTNGTDKVSLVNAVIDFEIGEDQGDSWDFIDASTPLPPQVRPDLSHFSIRHTLIIAGCSAPPHWLTPSVHRRRSSHSSSPSSPSRSRPRGRQTQSLVA